MSGHSFDVVAAMISWTRARLHRHNNNNTQKTNDEIEQKRRFCEKPNSKDEIFSLIKRKAGGVVRERRFHKAKCTFNSAVCFFIARVVSINFTQIWMPFLSQISRERGERRGFACELLNWKWTRDYPWRKLDLFLYPSLTIHLVSLKINSQTYFLKLLQFQSLILFCKYHALQQLILMQFTYKCEFLINYCSLRPTKFDVSVRRTNRKRTAIPPSLIRFSLMNELKTN